MAVAVEYNIVEVFEITGRGAVAVIAETTDLSVKAPHRAEVITPDGTVLKTEASKGSTVRREPVLVETETYLLKGLHKPDVPIGSRLRFLDYGASRDRCGPAP